MKNKIKKSKGFTLVEFMVATAITMIIFASIYLIIRQSQLHMKSILAETSLTQKGKLAYQSIAQFVYESNSFTISTSQYTGDTLNLKVVIDEDGNTQQLYVYYYKNPLSQNDPLNNTIFFDNDTNPSNGVLNQFLNKPVHSIKNVIPIPGQPIFEDILSNGKLLGMHFQVREPLYIGNFDKTFIVNTMIHLRN